MKINIQDLYEYILNNGVQTTANIVQGDKIIAVIMNNLIYEGNLKHNDLASYFKTMSEQKIDFVELMTFLTDQILDAPTQVYRDGHMIAVLLPTPAYQKWRQINKGEVISLSELSDADMQALFSEPLPDE